MLNDMHNFLDMCYVHAFFRMKCAWGVPNRPAACGSARLIRGGRWLSAATAIAVVMYKGEESQERDPPVCVSNGLVITRGCLNHSPAISADAVGRYST
jgi:hypothetical protein